MKKLTIIVIIFLLLGAWMIYDGLSAEEGKVSFTKKYFGWLFGVSKNVVKVGGYAVQQDWLPNATEPNINSTE